MLTTTQIRLVQDSWLRVMAHPEQAMHWFYHRLFELNPLLQRLFKGDIDTQGRRLITMIDTAVQSLDHLQEIVPILQASGARHQHYGVADEDYSTVAEALIWTLQQALGTDLNNATRDAWVNVYMILSNTMKDGAHAPLD